MSKLFLAADCDAEALAFLKKCAPSLVGTTTLTRPVGFHLVKDTLVPYSFLDDLGCELSHARLNCFEVTKISELFEEGYLDSLTESEHDVLGECVLLLIEQGIVPFSLLKKGESA